MSRSQQNGASMYTPQNGWKSGASTTPNVVGDWRQEEHLFLMRMTNDLATLTTNSNIVLRYNTAIMFLGLYPQRHGKRSLQNLYTNSQSSNGNPWRQSRHPSVGEWKGVSCQVTERHRGDCFVWVQRSQSVGRHDVRLHLGDKLRKL